MPRGDGRGPFGFGPMTGRKAGYCAGFSTPGFANLGRNRRFLGRGHGWRHCFYETGLPYWARKNYYLNKNVFNEEEILKKEADYLTEQLDKLKERLNQIRKQKKEGPNNN